MAARGHLRHRDKPEVAAYEVDITPTGLHFEADYDRYSIDKRHGAQTVEQIHYSYDLTLPFYTRLNIRFPDGHYFILFNMPSPRSARQSNILFRMTRDFDVSGPDDVTLEVQRGVLPEDKPIVEAQRPEKRPLDLSEKFHIRSDRLSTYYRRAWCKWVWDNSFLPEKFSREGSLLLDPWHPALL